MSQADLIGKRGEAIVQAELLAYFGGPAPLFDPTFLGEKFASFDLLVRLMDSPVCDAFFFAQVKTTRQGVRPRSQKLPVTLARKDVVAALRWRVPSYLLSVDERSKAVFVTAIDRRVRVGLTAVPCSHPFNATNARALWDEVQSFWRGIRLPRGKSHFSV